MNINQCGCRPYEWLGLDGNRCIRVIPRQYLWVPLLQLNLRSLLSKATHKCVLPLQLQTVSCSIDPAINVNDKVAFYLKLISPVFRTRSLHVFQNTDARVIFYVQQILKITNDV